MKIIGRLSACLRSNMEYTDKMKIATCEEDTLMYSYMKDGWIQKTLS